MDNVFHLYLSYFFYNKWSMYLSFMWKASVFKYIDNISAVF